MSQLFYLINSEQPKNALSSPAWQWAACQDLPLSLGMPLKVYCSRLRDSFPQRILRSD